MREDRVRHALSMMPSHGVKRFKLALLLSALIVANGAFGVLAKEKPKWKVEWERVVEAARKDGQVNVYIYNTAASVIDAGVFQKAFPGIKVVAVPGSQPTCRGGDVSRAGYKREGGHETHN